LNVRASEKRVRGVGGENAGHNARPRGKPGEIVVDDE
jgi:hypothetical protein